MRSVCDLAYYNEEASKEIEFNPVYLHRGLKRVKGKERCCHNLVPETKRCIAILLCIMSFLSPGITTIASAFCDSRIKFRTLILGLVIQAYHILPFNEFFKEELGLTKDEHATAARIYTIS